MQTVPYQKSYVKDFISGMNGRDANVVLKKFYDGAYKIAGYCPGNGANKWNVIKATIGRLLEEKEKMIDVACGPGLCVKAMLDDGHDAYGMDIASLDDIWEQNGVKDRCITANVLDIPFPDRAFGVVVNTDMLEHLREEDIPIALKELFRVSDKFTCLSISTVEEAELICGRISCHLTVKDSAWWREQIIKVIGTDRFIELRNRADITFVIGGHRGCK